MATPLNQQPWPAQNPFLQRTVLAPTVPVAKSWKAASETFFAIDDQEKLLDTFEATKGRVALYSFTQHQVYLTGWMRQRHELENVVSEVVEDLDGRKISDRNHWASDPNNGDRVTSERASHVCDKRKDHVKREIFDSFRTGISQTMADMGGLTVWQQATRQDRLNVFSRIFDEDPLEMAKLSAGNVVSKRTIDFDALYHHDEMINDAGDDLAGYMKEWIRYKFIQTCEIIFQKYVLVTTKAAKVEATGQWRELWQTWTRNVKHMDANLLIPENWPSF